jgi:hypothetical protein
MPKEISPHERLLLKLIAETRRERRAVEARNRIYDRLDVSLRALAVMFAAIHRPESDELARGLSTVDALIADWSA